MSDRTPYHNHGKNDSPPNVERIRVTKLTFLRGTGCCEESPIRTVTAWYEEDGRFIAESDPSDEAAY